MTSKHTYTFIPATPDVWALVSNPGRYTGDGNDDLRIQQVVAWAFQDGDPGSGDVVLSREDGGVDYPFEGGMKVVFVGPREWCEQRWALITEAEEADK